MSLKRSMLKTLAMLAMESTMTADKNIYSNQRLSNEGMRFNPDYRRPSTSREKICAYSRKDAIKRLKARGEL